MASVRAEDPINVREGPAGDRDDVSSVTGISMGGGAPHGSWSSGASPQPTEPAFGLVRSRIHLRVYERAGTISGCNTEVRNEDVLQLSASASTFVKLPPHRAFSASLLGRAPHIVSTKLHPECR